MEERVSDLLQKINDAYWNTYIEYLQSKKGDRAWVEQNMEWLEKTVDKYKIKICSGSGYERRSCRAHWCKSC